MKLPGSKVLEILIAIIDIDDELIANFFKILEKLDELEIRDLIPPEKRKDKKTA